MQIPSGLPPCIGSQAVRRWSTKPTSAGLASGNANANDSRPISTQRSLTVEPLAHNQVSAGSTPAAATLRGWCNWLTRRSPKPKILGSNPSSRAEQCRTRSGRAVGFSPRRLAGSSPVCTFWVAGRTVIQPPFKGASQFCLCFSPALMPRPSLRGAKGSWKSLSLERGIEDEGCPSGILPKHFPAEEA